MGGMSLYTVLIPIPEELKLNVQLLGDDIHILSSFLNHYVFLEVQ